MKNTIVFVYLHNLKIYKNLNQMKTKKIIIAFFSFYCLFPTILNAQCDITIESTSQQICLGDCFSLSYLGGCQGSSTNIMSADFNYGTPGIGWASGSPNPSFTNPCGNDNDGTPHAWVGNTSSFPREFLTIPYSVTTACQICFDMKFATQGNSSPCEGPDEMDEGVSLQYSINGGVTWTDIVYYCPDGNQYPTNSWVGQSTSGGGSSGPFISWANYCVGVPAAAAGPATQFQWYQGQVTDYNSDHWGLDNVQISCIDSSVTTLWENNHGFSYSGHFPPLQCPPDTGTYIYTLTINDSIYSDTDTIEITSLAIPDADAGYGGNVCDYDFTLNANTICVIYDNANWTSEVPGVIISNPTNEITPVNISDIVPGVYGSSCLAPIHFYWTLYDTAGCSNSDTVLISFYQTAIAYAGQDDSINNLSYSLSAIPSINCSYGEWSVISKPTGTGIENFVDFTNPQTTVNVPIDGNWCFLWEESNEYNSICMSRDTVCIFFDDSANFISNNISIKNEINIYPNPSNDFIYINISNEDELQVEIFDINGKSLFNKNIFDKNKKIDVSGFSKGVYILRIRNNNEIFHEKLIID